MFFLALIFCLTSGAFAQSLGFGRCPNVDTLESFDANEVNLFHPKILKKLI